MKNLEGRVAFITGASSGIGAAMAREFARRGAAVVLTARRMDRIETAADEIRALGQKALAIRCDVTAEDDLTKAMSTTIEELGRVDWVVANAGFGVAGRFSELQIEDYRRQFETNVFGVLRTAAATWQPLVRSRGSFVIMGSVMSFLGLPGSSPYAMSKAAVRAFADSLRGELRNDGVAVTLLAPGFVDSELRQVDNRGVHHETASDPIPARIRMDVDIAARKMVSAVLRRKRVAVITGHGKLSVFLDRHLPALTPLLVRVLGLERRRHRNISD